MSSETPRVPAPEAPAAAAPPKKRRRWRKRLVLAIGAVAVLLLALIGFAPQLASLPLVRDQALDLLNARLRGRVQLASCALSWTGTNELHGLRLLDGQQREVLTVKRVSVTSGLWSLLMSGMDFGTIELDAPTVSLTLDDTNRTNLMDAVAARDAESAPATDATGAAAGDSVGLPALRGRLVIRDGSVSVSRAGGEKLEAGALACDLRLDTLADIRGDLELTLQGAARISGNAAVQGLARDGKLDVGGASGSATLASDRPIDLAPLARLFAPQLALTGDLKLDAAATFGEGKVQANIVASARALRSAQSDGVRPLDASLDGDFTITPQDASGRVKLESPAGGATAVFRYALGGSAPMPGAERLIAAALSGESLTLPDFSLSAQAGIDLAAVERAIPGLLKLRDGQRLAGGRVEIGELLVRGGANPSAKGDVALAGLEIETGERVLRPAPIALGFDTALVPGKGLEVRQAALQSAFAKIAASGFASDMSATVDADLTKLQSELGALFDLGDTSLAGAVRGSVKLARADAQNIGVVLDLQGQELRCSFGERRLELPKATIRQTGRITLADQKLARLEAQHFAIDLNGEVVASGAGWFDPGSGGLDAKLSVARADLGFLGARAGGVGGAQLARYGGVLTGELQATRTARDEPLLTSGRIAAQDLSVDGKSLDERDAAVRWSGTQVAPDFSRVQIAQAQLQSSAAQLDASKISARFGDKLALDLDVSGSADLARLLTLLTPVLELESTPAVAGRLTLSGSAATSGDQVSASLRSGIAGLEIGAGAQRVRQEQVDLALETQIDNAAKKISLKSATVRAPLLSAELRGDVSEFDRGATLALSGSYELAWEPLTQLLHEFAPLTKDSVALSGRSAGDLRASGPVSSAGATPAFRDLSASTRIGWGGATVYGVPLGGAVLSPTLAGGKLAVPLAEIAAAGGRLRLGGTVDFTGADATYVLPERTVLLENVPVNRAVSEALLSRLNPVFSGLTQIEGTMSLVTSDVLVPLGDSLRERGAGRGRLDMKAVKLQPAGLLTELLALGVLAAGAKQGETYAVEVSGCDFALEQGRLRYDDLTLTFPGAFDLRFHGSVGLDESLDLVVSIPVSAPLLERLGVSGVALQYVKDLHGARIEAPLVGTRAQPKLDLARVDVEPIVRKLLESQAGGAVEDLLRGLGGGRKDNP